MVAVLMEFVKSGQCATQNFANQVKRQRAQRDLGLQTAFFKVHNDPRVLTKAVESCRKTETGPGRSQVPSPVETTS